MGSLGDQELGLNVFNTTFQEEPHHMLRFSKHMYHKCLSSYERKCNSTTSVCSRTMPACHVPAPLRTHTHSWKIHRLLMQNELCHVQKTHSQHSSLHSHTHIQKNTPCLEPFSSRFFAIVHLPPP